MSTQSPNPEQGSLLDPAAVQDFRSRVRGAVLESGHSEYEDARRIQNGLIDRRPALIVRSSGTADVVEAVNFARDRGLLLSIRGGGHNVAGNAMNDGGVVIDLAAMRGVHVDAATGTVRAAGGATWGDVDRETQLFGLAIPGGVVSTTGIAGLTLHGGYGHLRRTYGLSIDSLLSVQIVTADGQVRTASPTENADLFWAVRGAGSNFGVVTSFEFRAHPVGPIVQLCAPFYALEDGRKALRAWRRIYRDRLRRDQLCRDRLECARRGGIPGRASAAAGGDSGHGVRRPSRGRRSNHAAVARARVRPCST